MLDTRISCRPAGRVIDLVRKVSRHPALALGLALALPATPAMAESAAEFALPAASVPPQLDSATRAFYADVFRLIDAQDWQGVTTLLASQPTSPLRQVALAEYYLHPNSPRIDLPALNEWLAAGRELPQAEQIGRLALKRGLEYEPALPGAQRLVSLRSPAKRVRPRETGDGTMPDTVAHAILEAIKNDDPTSARTLLGGVDATLSAESRAEWRQRVAWSYYIENDDVSALTLSRSVAIGGTGPWVGEGWWVAGLAAWRLGDCRLAADGFARAAQAARNEELTAAAHYWAARAYTRCREPERAAPALRAAGQLHETLYGMLAAEQLNLALPAQAAGERFSETDWRRLADEPNVHAAVALVEVGRDGLADEVIRHQARIGDPQDYASLSRLARALGLPGAQLYMAYHAPSGAQPDPATRYPATRWAPVEGWRVDPALAYAHTLQESNFRSGAVSPAAAVGLMQITPITVRQHAPSLGLDAARVDLKDPRVNMSFGQRNLEMLRDAGATQGLLPKIMAAYNAGLSPITRWNTEVRDQRDPLLYMESIPYWETRAYVAIVTRNYWMYQRQHSQSSDTREALVQNLWPRFPTPTGAAAYAMHGRPVLSTAAR